MGRGQLNPVIVDLLFDLISSSSSSPRTPGHPQMLPESSALSLISIWISATVIELSQQLMEESRVRLNHWENGALPVPCYCLHPTICMGNSGPSVQQKCDHLPYARHCCCARDPAVTRTDKRSALLDLYRQ